MRSSEPTEGAAGPTDRGASEVEPPPAEEKKFDPYKFQTNTMPPGLRANLIAAGLPRVAPERIEDTLPPRGVTRDELTSEERRDDVPLASTTPVVKDGSKEPRIVARVFRFRAIPRWAMVVVAALVWGVVVLMLVVPRRAPSESPSPELVAKPAQLERELARGRHAEPRDSERGAKTTSSSTSLPQLPSVPEATGRSREATPIRAPQSPRLPLPRTGPARATSAQDAPSQPSPPVNASENPFDKPFKPPSE